MIGHLIQPCMIPPLVNIWTTETTACLGSTLTQDTANPTFGELLTVIKVAHGVDFKM